MVDEERAAERVEMNAPAMDDVDVNVDVDVGNFDFDDDVGTLVKPLTSFVRVSS